MPILPFPSWCPDIISLNGSTTQVAQNVLPRADGYGPAKGFAGFSQSSVSGNDTATNILLHLDSTNFVDNAFGVTPATWAAASTTVTSVTSTSKFGAGALQVGGVSSSYIDTASNTNFNVGSTSFETDFWFKPIDSNNNYNILGQADSNFTAGSTSFFFNRTGSVVKFAVSNGTSIDSVTTSTLTDSTAFYHIAGARQSGFLYLMLNGILQNTPLAVNTNSVTPNSPQRFAVGRVGEVTTSTLNGFLDEVRLSVGSSRYTLSSTLTPGATVFTVPTAAYGSSAQGTPLPGVCRGMFTARNTTDGSVTFFAATASALFKFDTVSLGWVNVSKAGGYTSLPATYNWQFAQFGQTVIAVQPNVNPQAFALNSSTVFADLGGLPPQAAYVTTVNRFLVLSGLTGNTFRIQWSGLNAITTWTSGVNSSDFQDLPDGGLVRGVAGGEIAVIFQDTVIRRFIFQPGSAYVFYIERVVEDKGLLAPYSIIRAAGTVFFLAGQGFHLMSPTGYPTAIGKERVDRTFFGDFDSSNMQLVIGAADPANSRVMWAYKSQGATGAQFDKILIYDYVLERWSILVNQVGQYIGSFAAPGISLDALDAIMPSLEVSGPSLDTFTSQAQPQLAMFNNTNSLGTFTGMALEAIIDTPEEVLDTQRRVRVRGLIPITDASGAMLSVGARENLQSAVVYSTEQAVNVRGFAPAAVDTRLARGRLRVIAGTQWTFASGIEIGGADGNYVSPRGLR